MFLVDCFMNSVRGFLNVVVKQNAVVIERKRDSIPEPIVPLTNLSASPPLVPKLIITSEPIDIPPFAQSRLEMKRNKCSRSYLQPSPTNQIVQFSEAATVKSFVLPEPVPSEQEGNKVVITESAPKDVSSNLSMHLPPITQPHVEMKRTKATRGYLRLSREAKAVRFSGAIAVETIALEPAPLFALPCLEMKRTQASRGRPRRRPQD